MIRLLIPHTMYWNNLSQTIKAKKESPFGLSFFVLLHYYILHRIHSGFLSRQELGRSNGSFSENRL